MPGNNKSNRPSGTRQLVAPELLPGLETMPNNDFDEQVLQAIRAGLAPEPVQPRPLRPEQQAVSCQERFIPGSAGAPDVRVLVYTPPGTSNAPRAAYLHIHGGGYVLGEPEFNDGSNRTFAQELGCVVVSVDYRLAPETRFPGAVEDCYAALKWLHSNAEALGVDRSRIAIGGESAGGGHAAALAILARSRGGPAIRLQLLDSPMIDDRTGSTSDPHPHCGEFVWTAASNRFGWSALLGVEPGGPDVAPGSVPARVADLTGLPPAFISVGALDLFLEENVEYARRLIRAGVPTELYVIPGAFHGFTFSGEGTPQVRTVERLRRNALARALCIAADSG